MQLNTIDNLYSLLFICIFILGYHACRMLAASTDVASVVGKGIAKNQHPDRIAADAYQAIWGKQNRGQRDFQVRYFHHFMPRHLIFLSVPTLQFIRF